MFSKSCKYAIRAVLYLAVNTSPEKKLGTKEVADNLDIPKPFLAKILQQLSRHQILSSSKGAGGGFYIDPEKNVFSLSDVIEIMDGTEVFTGCILGLAACSSENPCPLHNKAMAYRQSIFNQMEHQSIEDFAKMIKKENLTI